MYNYEKLCEAAEVEKQYNCRPHIDLHCKLGQCSSSCAEYPPFTAEKQIELIKLIAKRNIFKLGYIDDKYICYGNNDEYAYQMDIDFTEALAGLALQLIEAGELDKDEIRRILE